ncbi:MAG: hypothetical protein ACRCT8_08840 [Lacipirellulaceae bacterium]
MAQTKTSAASRKKSPKATAAKSSPAKVKAAPKSQGPASGRGKKGAASLEAPAKRSAKPGPAKSPRRDESAEVSIDRRRVSRRDEASATPVAETPVAPAAKLERREKVNRRRQIDPTTCERDYSESEVEFMNALDDYKRKNGRMFPTCSEVLEVIRGLGYVQLSRAELAARGAADDDSLVEDAAEREAREALVLSAQFREEPQGLPLVESSRD